MNWKKHWNAFVLIILFFTGNGLKIGAVINSTWLFHIVVVHNWMTCWLARSLHLKFHLNCRSTLCRCDECQKEFPNMRKVKTGKKSHRLILWMWICIYCHLIKWVNRRCCSFVAFLPCLFICSHRFVLSVRMRVRCNGVFVSFCASFLMCKLV